MSERRRFEEVEETETYIIDSGSITRDNNNDTDNEKEVIEKLKNGKRKRWLCTRRWWQWQWAKPTRRDGSVCKSQKGKRIDREKSFSHSIRVNVRKSERVRVGPLAVSVCRETSILTVCEKLARNDWHRNFQSINETFSFSSTSSATSSLLFLWCVSVYFHDHIERRDLFALADGNCVIVHRLVLRILHSFSSQHLRIGLASCRQSIFVFFVAHHAKFVC